MKTTLKFKASSLIVAEQPLLSATIVVFFSAVVVMAIFAVFQNHLVVTKIAKYSFWAIAILGVVHFTTTKIFITRFSRNKHRIPLLYYGGRVKIYTRPIFKRVPCVEIIFPDNWNVNHTMRKHSVELLLGVRTSDTTSFLLVFNLDMEMFGEFKAKELENLISSQKAQRPAQKKFELVSCLGDFLVADILRHHHSIKFLLEDYRLRQINFKSLEAGLLQVVKIPDLFTNVKKMDLSLTDVRRMVKLEPTFMPVPFNKAAVL